MYRRPRRYQRLRRVCDRYTRERLSRLVSLSLLPVWSSLALAHHSVISVYDDERRFTLEVQVLEFELIDPHPLIFVEVIGIPQGQTMNEVAPGQTWTLEMDNARELRALGFYDQTFLPGDRMLVAVDPSRHTRYRKNTLYLRAAEHRREGFIYLHNVRKLLPRASTEDSLPNYLELIR